MTVHPRLHKPERLAKELLRPFYLRWLYFSLFPTQKPRSFVNCWNYPACPLDSEAAAELLCKEGPPPTFLFLPMSNWHARMQRTEHLAACLANLGHTCFILNPYLGRQFPSVYFRDKIHRISSLARGLTEVHVRLPREPVYYHRLLTRQENHILVTALEKILCSLRGQSVVQIVSLPTWFRIAAELKAKYRFPIIYDCHDLLEGFRDVHATVKNAERELLETCDLLVFSSEYLQQFKLRQSPNMMERSVVLRNAADPLHFSPSLEEKTPRRRSLSQSRLIGYVGSLDDWFDVDSVERSATSHPNWRFQLLGRIECSNVRRLQRLSNIEFFGEVPYADLPQFLIQFDVALIPFIKNDLTLSASPIKLYEYFSCGIPVVSTRLPEVERFADMCYLADDPVEFVSQLDRAAMEVDAGLRLRRRQVALKETWCSRAKELRDLAVSLCPPVQANCP